MQTKIIISTIIFILVLISIIFNLNNENSKIKIEAIHKEEVQKIEAKNDLEKAEILSNYLKEELKKKEDEKVSQKYYKKSELEIGRDWDKDYPTQPNGQPEINVK